MVRAREDSDIAIRAELNAPPSYFLSLATDYPHKNLPNLLDAYAMLRSRWQGGEPPGLVLAGHMTTSRMSLYSRMQSDPMGQGVTFLGPVTRDQLRVLYQDALALVFPSLYEGFGLPPLEAMAAGTPVIAMPISSLPEVAGDGVLYPGGLASKDLARAMESVVCDEGLRDELRERGLRRVEQFRWENTARATVERLPIRDPEPVRAITPDAPESPEFAQLLGGTGLSACGSGDPRAGARFGPRVDRDPQRLARALNFALYTRLRRELERFQPLAGRESA